MMTFPLSESQPSPMAGTPWLGALIAVLAGCGDSGGAETSGATSQVTSASASATGTSTSATTTGASDSAGGETESGGATGGASASTTSDTGLKLDVGAPDGEFDCGCELSYVWVANSPEGTVSKINMATLEEEGRYLTRADGQGNPSRTSVGLNGDVAVANRHGGLVKFYADVANCKESNGIPGIQTSTGKDDVLPWDMEECRAWYIDFPTTNQRPVAFTQGYVTPGTCDSSNEKIWTVMSATKSLFPGLGGPGGVIVSLVDGATGAIEKQVKIDTFSGDQFGAYGGAVNSRGDLYFTSMAFNGGKLAWVSVENFAYKVWTIPPEIGPYGITVDHNDRVWVSSASIGQIGAGRFDPTTETWATVNQGFWAGAGLAEGKGNLMWISSHLGISSVDVDTFAPGPVFKTDETVKGVGVDLNGFVWGVTYEGEDEMGNPVGKSMVMKIDPATMQLVGTYEGLDHPYTYSDFTGNALANVTCMPPS